MQTLADVERAAVKLPECDRASLASRLLDSLPRVLSDSDDGIAEALRRDAEEGQDPAAMLIWEEMKRNARS
jgi:hypothetical protein